MGTIAIGYYSLGLCGYEVEVDSSGDYVYWEYVGTGEKQKRHKSKIFTTKSGRLYFRANNKRIFLDEVMRI